MAETEKSLQIYQFHVLLRSINPPVWRRILMPRQSTIADLYYTLQIAFSWSDLETRKKRVLRGHGFGFDPHPRIPSRERYAPVIIQHSSADLQQQVSPALTPPHLLLLDHPPGNHLVDR